MANVIDLVSSDEEEVSVVWVIPSTILEMSEHMIFARYDFKVIRSTQFPFNTGFNMDLSEAILAADCAATHTTVRPSSIAKGTRGLFTEVDVEDGMCYDYWGIIRLQRVGTNVLDDEHERAAKFKTQPFYEKFNIEMFLVGSLSCAATYMNDNNYLRIPGEDRERRNNCYIVETRFDELTEHWRTADFDFWLEHGPLKIETKMGVRQKNELSCDYFM